MQWIETITQSKSVILVDMIQNNVTLSGKMHGVAVVTLKYKNSNNMQMFNSSISAALQFQ